MAKAGRKGLYYSHVQPRLFEIKMWCRNGLIDIEIVKRLGIGMSTFSSYKIKYLELQEVLKEGKEIADFQVENALFKRAKGYSYVEVIKESKLNPETGEYEMTITKETVKQVAPDPTAIIYWTKNRDPRKWKDAQVRQVEGSLTINDKLENFFEK